MPDKLRAVLDTNLLVRGILTPHGFTGQILRAAADDKFVLVTSEYILDEVTAVLSDVRVARYGPFTPLEIEAAVATLRKAAVVVKGTYTVYAVTDDPKDNPILACALEGHADFIVTDDRRHLLPMKSYHRIQIISAPDFLRHHVRVVER